MTRRTLRLRWIAAIAFVSINCGPVQRKTRTSVEIDGRYGEAYDTTYGCDTGFVHRWEHEHLGGSAAVDYQNENGLTAGGRLRMQRGDLVRYEVGDDTEPKVIDPEDRAYALYAIGGRVGYDGKNLGGALGASVATVDGDAFIVYPYGSLKIGDLDAVWFELLAGSDDPLHIARVLSLGLGARGEDVNVQAGLGLYGQLVPDLSHADSGSLTVGAKARDLDVGAAVDVAWRPVDHIGLTGGVVVGAARAVRFGVSWAFGQ